MVDVGGKDTTHRIAEASGSIFMQAETLANVRDMKHQKGDVLGVARIAGIMAAKKTPDFIPLCHPLQLSRVEVAFETSDDPARITCRARVETRGPTGVEMEALAAVHIALLTIYDMCKGADRGMRVGDIALDRKAGGRSGDWRRAAQAGA